MPSKDKRKLAAIMFADVVGYSRMMASNEKRTLELLKDFENICSPIISKHDGEIIKKVGDELFCEFSSAKQAVDSALAIQEAIQPYNDSRPKDFKLQVRIGIHVGDIVLRDGDVFGDGVNVASRIQPLASPGGICISGSVSDAISSHPEYNIISKGEQELKNILKKHSVFEIKTGYETIDIDNVPNNKLNTFQNLRIIVVLLFLTLIGYSIYYFGKDSAPNQVDIIPEEILFLVGDIISDSYYIEGLKWHIPRYIDYIHEDMSFELEIISDSLKDFLYDELVTNIEVNNNFPNLIIMNKYELNQFYTSKGKLTPDYFSKMLLEFKKNSIEYSIVKSTESAFVIDTSMILFIDIMREVGARLGAISGIYRLKGIPGERVYVLYSSFLKNIDHDAQSGTFNVEVYSYKELKKSLYEDIINNLNNYIIPNEETNIPMYIIDIKRDNVIFKFLRPSKYLKEGTILSVQRHYTLTSNDSLKTLNKRLDDLYHIKDIIDKIPDSEAHKHFYDKTINRNSMEEINALLAHDHLLAKEVSGNNEVSLWSNLGIKLKVTGIFDSTASAIIYKKDRESEPTASYAKVRIDDWVVFMK